MDAGLEPTVRTRLKARGKWLVKVSWFGKLVSVFWWVELDFFSPENNEVSSSEF